MKNFLKKLVESDFTMPVTGTLFWLIILIVNCSIAWSDDPLTNKSFIRLLIPAVLLIMNVLSLGECSKLRETKRIVDRLDILAKMTFRNDINAIELEKYKKLLSDDDLKKWNKMDIWEPCIFKPCMEQPGSHQDLDGYYNKELNIFKIDPHFHQDKSFDGIIWKEEDVLEFTMKGID
jgi:hypothetical protein